jgi:hypothetical protein
MAMFACVRNFTDVSALLRMRLLHTQANAMYFVRICRYADSNGIDC